MARTVKRHVRFYADGYDLSGYGRTVGPLLWRFDEADLTCEMSDAVRGVLPNHCHMSPGTFHGVFDNTATSGLHAVLSSPGSARTLMIPVGMAAAPTEGDPTYCGIFQQASYVTKEDGGAMVVEIPFDEWDVESIEAYQKPWGHLIHAKGAETGANAGTNDHDNGAATSAGGYMVYQIFAGDGTATISIDDSADDAAWLALSGATSGELDCSSVQYGLVALGTSATVRRYLRWQISLNTATTVTFALAFVRG